MLKGIIIEKLREVKDGIFTEVKNKIEQIESMSSKFNYTDLKVRNISSYLYEAVRKGLLSDNEATELFNHITMLEYDHFQEWESENLNYVQRSYIGRTSSFYYDSNWYGDIVENWIIEDLLEGKKVLKESLGELDVHLYDYLFEIKKFDEIDFSFDNEDELNDWLETEIEMLESLSDDLDTVKEIVNEAKLAYDYLVEYKTKENEYEVAEHYLKDELEERCCEVKAEKLFEQLLEICTPLNKIEYLNLFSSIVNEKYVINAVSNVCETTIDTKISSAHKLSADYIAVIMCELIEKRNEIFE